MSRRLTVTLRDRIVENVLRHRFQKEEQAEKATHHELGIAVYNAMFPADVRSKMAALPLEFFPVTDRLTLRDYAESGHQVVTEVKLPHHLPISNIMECSYYIDGYGHYPEVQALREALHLEEEAENLKEKVRFEVQNMVASVNTVKRLLEIWPEVEPFIPDMMPVSSGQLVVQTDKLNAMLGLPIETVATPEQAEAA